VSPDGRQVAFVVTTSDEEQQDDYRSRIWLVATAGASAPRPLPLAGGEASPLTDREDGAGEAGKRAEAGEPLRITRLKYKFDGRNFIHGRPSHRFPRLEELRAWYARFLQAGSPEAHAH